LLRGLGVMLTGFTVSDADWLDCEWLNLLKGLGVMLTALIVGGSICWDWE
jgi:hypothetical protein